MSEKRKTTLDDIEAIPREILIPEDVADFLGVHQYSINLASKAGELPWAYNIGSRTKIPKAAFLSYHRHGAAFVRNEVRV